MWGDVGLTSPTPHSFPLGFFVLAEVKPRNPVCCWDSMHSEALGGLLALQGFFFHSVLLSVCPSVTALFSLRNRFICKEAQDQISHAEAVCGFCSFSLCWAAWWLFLA